MLLTEFLTKLFGVGFILTIVSMGGRVSDIELSRHMTGLGLALVGFSLSTLCMIAAPLMDSPWDELEFMLRFFTGVMGLLLAIWGLWRINKHTSTYSKSEEAFLRKHLQGKHTILQNTDFKHDVRSHPLYVKGWVFTIVGTLIYLILILTVDKEQTIDGSPASLVLLAFIIVGGLFLIIGRNMLTRYARIVD